MSEYKCDGPAKWCAVISSPTHCLCVLLRYAAAGYIGILYKLDHASTWMAFVHLYRYFVPDPSLICALCEESSLWLEDCMDVQPRELIPQLSLGLDQSRALPNGRNWNAERSSAMSARIIHPHVHSTSQQMLAHSLDCRVIRTMRRKWVSFMCKVTV